MFFHKEKRALIEEIDKLNQTIQIKDSIIEQQNKPIKTLKQENRAEVNRRYYLKHKNKQNNPINQNNQQEQQLNSPQTQKSSSSENVLLPETPSHSLGEVIS